MASLSSDDAAHLLRRMGFGGTPDEIDALVQKGREGAVDYLINYQSVDNSAMETLLANSFDFSGGAQDNSKFNQNIMRAWWMTRMIYTRRPFEEKMTLFWHNHFATALSKVQDQYMYAQNLTLRKYALDRFDTLLLKVAQDPAMLIWLDGLTSDKTTPNENFARELQELFSQGINDVVTRTPNYTEDDVKAIARAFTGWRFRRVRNSGPFDFEWFVDNNQHDNTTKTIYGQTANFSGEDVVTIIAAKPATARFLTKKLFDFFVYPIDVSSSADRNTVDKFATVYTNTNHSIKELVRAIFGSDEFFSDRARFALVKLPIEYVVNPVRMLNANYIPGTSGGNQRETQLYSRSRLMGMDIFNPPDVSGWDLQLAWVSTATMLERFNYGNFLISQRPNNTPNAGVYITNDQLKAYTKSSAKKTVKKFLGVLNAQTDGPTLKQLMKYLTTDDQGNSVDWVVTDANIDKKIRGLVHQILCLPAFNLN